MKLIWFIMQLSYFYAPALPAAARSYIRFGVRSSNLLQFLGVRFWSGSYSAFTRHADVVRVNIGSQIIWDVGGVPVDIWFGAPSKYLYRRRQLYSKDICNTLHIKLKQLQTNGQFTAYSLQPTAYRPTAYRPTAYRPTAYRPTAYKPTAYRP